MAKKEETYNEAIEKLRKIVAEIENGDLDVDILSEKVKEATRLIKLCSENLKMAKELGYNTFFWSLAYVDWNVDNQPTKEEAFDKLLTRIHPGAIVLLHSTSKTNGEILDELLTKWEEMGYTFAPLSELIAES